MKAFLSLIWEVLLGTSAGLLLVVTISALLLIFGGLAYSITMFLEALIQYSFA